MNSTIWNPTFFAHSIEEAKATISAILMQPEVYYKDNTGIAAIEVNCIELKDIDWNDFKDEPVLHISVWAEFEISALQGIVDKVNDQVKP